MSIELNILWLLKPLSRHAGKLEDVAKHIVRLCLRPTIFLLLKQRPNKISPLKSVIVYKLYKVDGIGLPFLYIDPYCYWFWTKKYNVFCVYNKCKRNTEKKLCKYFIKRCYFWPENMHSTREKKNQTINKQFVRFFCWMAKLSNPKISNHLRIAWKMLHLFFVPWRKRWRKKKIIFPILNPNAFVLDFPWTTQTKENRRQKKSINCERTPN